MGLSAAGTQQKPDSNQVILTNKFNIMKNNMDSFYPIINQIKTIILKCIKWVFPLLCVLAFNPLNAQSKGSIDSLVSNYAHKNRFNGTVLVQKGTEIAYHKGFGIADRRFNVPIKKETIYKVASITKAFTAVLILQLRDCHKINLNETIDKYLIDYKGEAGSKVTIQQLLNHTSGMRQIDTITSLKSAFENGLGYLQSPHSSDQLFHLFEKDSLVNEPGEVWDYNNYEYIVLGKIIEEIYGKTYEEVLKERIFNPLDMNDSGLLFENDVIEDLASTYFVGEEPDILLSEFPYYIENWYAAGSMYSCSSDLAKFSNALFAHKLISSESLNLMLTPMLNEYGHGVWIRGVGDKKRMERYGSISGANAVWMHFLNKNVTIIILSNTNLTDLGDFALVIGNKLID